MTRVDDYGFDFLRHRFPLRPRFDVEFSLPRDLTAEEAERICALVRALATPPPPPSPSPTGPDAK